MAENRERTADTRRGEYCRASSNPHFANGPTLAPTRTLINDLLS
jgi:hypothetical protein